MIVAQNLPAALADAARADLELHVATIALGKEDRFLEDGHAESYRASTARLHGQPLTGGTDSPYSTRRRIILGYSAQQ